MPSSKMLHVRILSGECQLARNSFVRLLLKSKATDLTLRRLRTHTARGAQPAWNEEFVMTVEPAEQKAVFELVDCSELMDTLLGEVELDLSRVETSALPKTYILRAGEVAGCLSIYVAFLAETFGERTLRRRRRLQSEIEEPAEVMRNLQLSMELKVKCAVFREGLTRTLCFFKKTPVVVRRSHLLEDSKAVVDAIDSADMLRDSLYVQFVDESGLQHGGLAREWFGLLSQALADPGFGLFSYPDPKSALQINPQSGARRADHLDWFRFFGKIASMAVYHERLLDVCFSRSFYKALLQRPFRLQDVEFVDGAYYRSLIWLRRNDTADLHLTFAYHNHELVPGGANLAVTNYNKEQYIQRLVQWRFVQQVADQMSAFMAGFDAVVPLARLQIFEERELELVMCGFRAINVRDWQRNTVYECGYRASHRAIQFFWQAVYSFDAKMRARLLHFVTGTTRVPMTGFRGLHGYETPQRFVIAMAGNTDAFPTAFTCFNRLELPPYETYDKMRNMLMTAVLECEGFRME